MADWLDDLAEFPATHVAQACQEWRRTQTRRPTPAEIVSLTRWAKQSWEAKNSPAKLAPQERKAWYVPPAHVVRDDFRLRPTREWTRAELDIANAELDDKAVAAGFPAGLDGRWAYVKSLLAARRNPLLNNLSDLIDVPMAKEIS